jgi:signal peptidase I
MSVIVGTKTVIDSVGRLSNYRVTNFVISANTNASAGFNYVANSTVTLTLPSAPLTGDIIGFSNQSGSVNCIIAANGSNINGITQDLKVDVKNASIYLQYTNSSQGWIIF